MTLENKIAQLFQMDEATWTHHANPWSVWTADNSQSIQTFYPN
ncbi:MAG: hypothetical protein RH949_03955 [Coleofasciculus sp. A1-SPW-01]